MLVAGEAPRTPQIALQMKIRNHTTDVVRDFAAQVQKNAFGLGPGANLDVRSA